MAVVLVLIGAVIRAILLRSTVLVLMVMVIIAVILTVSVPRKNAPAVA